MSGAPEVVYVLPDKMGGVFNYVDNLLRYRQPDGLRYAAIATNNAVEVDTRASEPLPADRFERFAYGPDDNLYAILRRLASRIPYGPGVIVANDWIELAAASVHDTGRAVVAITHGDFDFYYDLARRHDAAIDAFVTYTDHMARRVRALLPHRAEDVHLLRYGVAIPPETRRPAAGPLRLLYVGRLHRNKGIFDLPAIDAELRRRNCDVAWTVQGTGPDEAELRAQWADPRVRWTGRQPMAAVLALYLEHDAFVLPCRFEGLPVALLEAGSYGVVPVISNLPSGIPEVVEPGVTGYRPEPGDIGGFADAIEQLARDRASLEAMSAAVRRTVARSYDAVRCTTEYQRLYAQLIAGRREWRPVPIPYGSRLDRRWMPNAAVKFVRHLGGPRRGRRDERGRP